MDKIKRYTDILDGIFAAKMKQTLAGQEGVKPHPIIDREHNDYLLLWRGWNNDEYTHAIMFHAQVIRNKIWIHEDHTDIDLKQLLVENGVASNDIVLGFDTPIEVLEMNY